MSHQFTPLPVSPSPSAHCKVSLLQSGHGTLPRDVVLLPAPNTPNASASSPSSADNTPLALPVYFFHITHVPTGTTYLFDLGMAADPAVIPPAVKSRISGPGWYFEAVSAEEVLSKSLGPEAGKKVKAVMYSHLHFDHVGDGAKSAGLEKAELWLGPTAAQWARPGWPEDEGASHRASDLPRTEGERVVRELRIPEGELKEKGDKRAGVVEKGVQEGKYEGIRLWEPEKGWQAVGSFERAADVFGDGSFWLLDAPGHCPGHMCGLVRVKVGEKEGQGDDWVLLAGDSFHHPDLLKEPERLARPPYAAATMHEDFETSVDTLKRVKRMAEQDNVWVVQAHDPSVGEVFGKGKGEMVEGAVGIDDWRAKGWKGKQGKA